MKEFKRYQKYYVLKIDDINEYCSSEEIEELDRIGKAINACRKMPGKKDNSYVVVNEDEPYAEKVWSLIEQAETGKELSPAEKIQTIEELGVPVDNFTVVIAESQGFPIWKDKRYTLREYLERTEQE